VEEGVEKINSVSNFVRVQLWHPSGLAPENAKMLKKALIILIIFIWTVYSLLRVLKHGVMLFFSWQRERQSPVFLEQSEQYKKYRQISSGSSSGIHQGWTLKGLTN